MILLIHFVATVFMTGVIWIVQVVIYPQLQHVSKVDFVQYEQSHMRRIGYVVGPMMLLEFLTAGILLIQGTVSGSSLRPFYASLALGIIIGLSTAVIQAPLHVQLAKEGKIDSKIKTLINSNWIRTVCWTGRTLLIGYITYLSLVATP